MFSLSDTSVAFRSSADGIGLRLNHAASSCGLAGNASSSTSSLMILSGFPHPLDPIWELPR